MVLLIPSYIILVIASHWHISFLCLIFFKVNIYIVMNRVAHVDFKSNHIKLTKVHLNASIILLLHLWQLKEFYLSSCYSCIGNSSGNSCVRQKSLLKLNYHLRLKRYFMVLTSLLINLFHHLLFTSVAGFRSVKEELWVKPRSRLAHLELQTEVNSWRFPRNLMRNLRLSCCPCSGMMPLCLSWLHTTWQAGSGEPWNASWRNI